MLRLNLPEHYQPVAFAYNLALVMKAKSKEVLEGKVDESLEKIRLSTEKSNLVPSKIKEDGRNLIQTMQ